MFPSNTDRLPRPHLKSEAKGGAEAKLGADTDGSPVGVHQLLDQGQAQASTAVLARSTHVDLHENKWVGWVNVNTELNIHN